MQATKIKTERINHDGVLLSIWSARRLLLWLLRHKTLQAIESFNGSVIEVFGESIKNKVTVGAGIVTVADSTTLFTVKFINQCWYNVSNKHNALHSNGVVV